MLKKLSLAGLVLMASSGIAFADPNDATSAADTSSTDATSSAASATGSNDSSATSESSSSKSMHKKHRKHKKHKKHHHYRSHTSQAAASTDSDAVVASAAVTTAAYKGDYKGEIAAPCPTCPPGIQAGPYVGLGLGSLLNYTSHHASYNGLEGNLFGGYGWLWDQWYGGLEVFVNDNLEMTNNTSPTYGSAKSSWSYGGSLLPGYLIQENVLGFLRLGVIETRFNGNGGKNKWKFGGQVGLGLQTMLCQNWGLRGEWMYNFYNSMGSASIGVPRAQQYNLSLLYNFQF